MEAEKPVEDSLAFDVFCLRRVRCHRRAQDEGARYGGLEFEKTGSTRLGVASLWLIVKTQD